MSGFIPMDQDSSNEAPWISVGVGCALPPGDRQFTYPLLSAEAGRAAEHG